MEPITAIILQLVVIAAYDAVHTKIQEKQKEKQSND